MVSLQAMRERRSGARESSEEGRGPLRGCPVVTTRSKRRTLGPVRPLAILLPAIGCGTGVHGRRSVRNLRPSQRGSDA